MKYYTIDSTVSVDKANDAQALRTALNVDQELVFFKKKADAVRVAKNEIDPKAKIQYPIYEIAFENPEENLEATEVTLADGKKVAGFSVVPNEADDFALLSASFAHINKKFKAVDLTAVKSEVDEKAEGKLREKKKNYVIAAGAATAVIAIGFWFSGFYQMAIAMLTKAGLALPAGVIGLAVVATLSTAYYGIYKLFTIVDNRTEDQKYHDKLISKEEKIKALSEKLTSDEDKKFLTDLHAILNIKHTAERKFKKDGEPIKNQPPAIDKLLVLKYEAKRLKEVVAAEGADRTKLETAILDTAKKDAAKKFIA